LSFLFFLSFCLFCLVVLGLELGVLCLRQALYLISLTSSSSCFIDYFSDWVSCFLLFDWPEIQILLPMPPNSWNYTCVPLCPSYLLRSGLASFLPKLVLNHNPPNLCPLSSRDYRSEPQCSAIFLFLYNIFLCIQLFKRGGEKTWVSFHR
jgi:hypothetical protein